MSVHKNLYITTEFEIDLVAFGQDLKKKRSQCGTKLNPDFSLCQLPREQSEDLY